MAKGNVIKLPPGIGVVVRWRSSKTEQFVSDDYAKKHPDATYPCRCLTIKGPLGKEKVVAIPDVDGVPEPIADFLHAVEFETAPERLTEVALGAVTNIMLTTNRLFAENGWDDESNPWAPKPVKTESLTCGEALELMKRGMSPRRDGWGQGLDGYPYLRIVEGRIMQLLTPTQRVQWVPSHEDLLAEDWRAL